MFTPYEPRPIEILGLETTAGMRLKSYSIRHDASPHDPARFAEAWTLAEQALPQPAVAAGRPGVGFAIQHQGRTGDYFILAWWDNENELPLRVFVNAGQGWRPAQGGESVCVWDLQAIHLERMAYVRTVLAGQLDGVEQYLSQAREAG